jgi:hypothetical protein
MSALLQMIRTSQFRRASGVGRIDQFDRGPANGRKRRIVLKKSVFDGLARAAVVGSDGAR